MKQMLLELDVYRPETLESFVIGQNAEVVELLRLFDQRQASSFGDHAAYLWGDAGSGKSHLLRALVLTGTINGQTARYINPASPLPEFDYSPAITLYLLDDCHFFNDIQQIAAFNLFNLIKENGAFFVAAGSLPPALLTVRDDFRTRLGWGLIYQLHGLTDLEKMAALENGARARGITIPEGVLSYLITHFHRDMPSLASLLEALINHALEVKHPITLPFLREVMQQQREMNG